MAQYKPQAATPEFLRARATWSSREAEILEGRALPHIKDFRAGHSVFREDAADDLGQQIRLDVESDLHTLEVLDLLNALKTDMSGDGCWQVYQGMGNAGEDVDVYLFHAALRGHPSAVSAWAADMMTSRNPTDRVGHLMGMSVALGMMSGLQVWDGSLEDSADRVRELRTHGQGILRRTGETMSEWDWATEQLEYESQYADQKRPGHAESKRRLEKAIEAMTGDAEFLRLVEEDRAEFFAPPSPPKPAAPVKPGLVVLGAMPAGDSKHRGEIARAVAAIAGKRLPLVGGDRVFAAGMRLHEDYPHLTEAIDRMMLPQVAREFPQFRALIVGPAGAGKSSVAMAVADALGLPSMVFNAGGASDAAFGGTSSQYASQRMSLPMQMIAQHGIANPLMIGDEIDKVASGRQNGSLTDVLLGMLEPSSARRYFDPALECQVDLSAVSFIMTANTLEDVPQPLRDRLQVIRVPEPSWEHVGVLSRRILDDLARGRGLDPRWIESLAEDELEIVHQAWPGGSLRRLRKILEVLVDTRDLTMGVH